MTLQLLACLARVQLLAACSRESPTRSSRESLFFLHTLEHFFTLSHSLPLQESHLNTGLLIAKIHAILARNKANKMVDKIRTYIKTLDFLFRNFTQLLSVWHSILRTVLLRKLPGPQSAIIGMAIKPNLSINYIYKAKGLPRKFCDSPPWNINSNARRVSAKIRGIGLSPSLIWLTIPMARASTKPGLPEQSKNFPQSKELNQNSSACCQSLHEYVYWSVLKELQEDIPCALRSCY